jgi:DUF438 domain-containing protein
MRHIKKINRKTYNEELRQIDEMLEKWSVAFADRRNKQKHISPYAEYKLTLLIDIWMWVKELRKLEDDNPRTAIEETAHLFGKKEDNEKASQS